MEIGKLPNDVLEKLILNDLENRRAETVLRPAVGEDCCALDLGENLCVISTDPITAADENAGLLAVLVSLNDLAASGAEPVGILTTVLLPPETTQDRISALFTAINTTCRDMNIDVLGGHTEVTDTVNKVLIITTAIGKVPPGGLIRSDGARSGDALLMTKAAGLEGTAIIVSDKNPDVSGFLSYEEIKTSASYIDEISVLKEGMIAARFGATSMHDITEGGVLGAAWELCSASGCGAEINLENIPVRDITKKICSHYNLNALKLISSGSMMITCRQSDKDVIMDKILKAGIQCSDIGVIKKERTVTAVSNGVKTKVLQPEADELYKVI